ncbi:MAG: MBL fold metallo-hydrolase [Rhodothermia bacterium]|nr:MBL fold metallo-hydrolase [Rhodothermia bacterium]
MIVRFWGVRGSMPSPGSSTARYGGNTACVSVEVGDDVLILDAGTGIRELGKALKGTDKRIFLALSHRHYDHILGFPLFAPLFEEGRIVYVIGYPDEDEIWTPLDLMDGVYWPVRPEDLRSDVRVVGETGYEMLSESGLRVDCLPVNHPGGAFGFRVRHSSRSFVHITDNELYPPGEPAASFEEVVEFCDGADALSHDAQYLDREMPMKEGWGHSLASTACELAIESRVRSLVLFHHDPDRSDDALDALGERSQDDLAPHGISVMVAYEGLALDLDRISPTTTFQPAPSIPNP